VSKHQQKHSPTHIYPDHQQSFICFLHLQVPQHPPCSIYVLDSLFAPTLSRSSLVYLLVWKSPLNTFLYPIIVFSLQYMPTSLQHVLLITEIMSSIPSYLRRRRRLCFRCGLFVCLSVCPSDYSQTCEQILTNFFGGVGHGSRTK